MTAAGSRSVPPCSSRSGSRSSSASSSCASRGRARSGCGCSPRACATPTSTSATASGIARRRSSWATRARASSRPSGEGVTTPRVGQLVALSWLIPCGVCRSCRRGHVWACPDSPSYRHTLLDGETAFRDGTRVVLRDRHDGRGERRPGRGRDPRPGRTDPAVAALIGCCVTTGVGAVLKTAAVPAGLERGGHRARRRRAVVRDGCRGRRGVADRGHRSHARQAGRGTSGRGHGHAPRRRRCRRHARCPARPDRRRPGLRVRGDRAAVDGRAGHRRAARRGHGRARRHDPARRPRLVRGLPVRRRLAAHPRLELRLRRSRDRLRRATRAWSRRRAACRVERLDRPTGSASTTSRTPSRRCGRGRYARQVIDFGSTRGRPSPGVDVVRDARTQDPTRRGRLRPRLVVAAPR